MANAYPYGMFVYGLGAFGTGPILEEEDESMLLKYGTSQVFYASVTKYGDVKLLDSGVEPFAHGDAQISIDGGAFINLVNNVHMQPLGSGQVCISLDSSETIGKLLTIRIKDQDNPPVWNDKTIVVETYGSSNAHVIDNFDNVVSASNFVATDLSQLATSAQSELIYSGVTALITDVMLDPSHALSALDNKIEQTSIAVGLIPTNNNGIVVSASNLSPITSGLDYIIGELANPVYGLSAIKSVVDTTVADVLGSDIDGMPMNIALEKIVAWAIGNTEYANSVFTYFKQDNVTQAFMLSATDTNRTRV